MLGLGIFVRDFVRGSMALEESTVGPDGKSSLKRNKCVFIHLLTCIVYILGTQLYSY